MAMTKIARTAPAVALLMFVGLALAVIIEPDGAKFEVRRALVGSSARRGIPRKQNGLDKTSPNHTYLG